MSRLFLRFACLSLPLTLLNADHIYVSGNVSGPWSADTVFVTGEIRVPPGETLVIEPGVKVLFQVNCKFIVDSLATLQAVGAATDSILFDDYGDPPPYWQGIRLIYAADASRFEYCHLTSGRADGQGVEASGGAIFLEHSSPTITNCLIDSCHAEAWGGAICCNYLSHPTISNNLIQRNSADYDGGAVACLNSSAPVIANNLIRENLASSGGGIGCNYSSCPQIIENLISANSATWGGGIECGDSCNALILGNTVSGNEAANWGGGIRSTYASPTLRGNLIMGNSAGGDGGGICSNLSYPEISGNLILDNVAETKGGGICAFQSGLLLDGNVIADNLSWTQGGGIHCENGGNSIIRDNTLCRNKGFLWGGGIYGGGTNLMIMNNLLYGNEAMEAEGQGGGLYLANTTSSVIKCTLWDNYAWLGGGICFGLGCTVNVTTGILWGNTAFMSPQIFGNQPVQYSDVQGGYSGMGNLNLDPSFVDISLNDCRLLWGSPCIDTGDPDPQYNDPDGTRADMGAFYFDQSVPVHILLSPHEIPYLIPETGGSMDYTIHANNWDSLAHAASIWCDVTLPDSSIYGPVLGPVTVTISAGQILARVRTQNVPAWAPLGVYHYNAYAVVGTDTSKDSFMWGKVGSSNDGPRDWSNFGEDFQALVGAQRAAPQSGSGATPIMLITPNPFNPSTVLSFELRAASFVTLEVYDINSREVGAKRCFAPTGGRPSGSPLQAWYPAGTHQITFDGSDLPSGLYFAKLTTGDFSQVQKLVLLK